jgi:hypothetical protein
MTRYPYQCVVNSAVAACATFITGSVNPTTTNTAGCICNVGTYYTDLNPGIAVNGARCVTQAACPSGSYADHRIVDGAVVHLGCRQAGLNQREYFFNSYNRRLSS